MVLHTYAGDLDVGIREGTAAWLDVNTMGGTVRNKLGAAGKPHTYTGDAVIRRSRPENDDKTDEHASRLTEPTPRAVRAEGHLRQVSLSGERSHLGS